MANQPGPWRSWPAGAAQCCPTARCTTRRPHTFETGGGVGGINLPTACIYYICSPPQARGFRTFFPASGALVSENPVPGTSTEANGLAGWRRRFLALCFGMQAMFACMDSLHETGWADALRATCCEGERETPPPNPLLERTEEAGGYRHVGLAAKPRRPGTSPGGRPGWRSIEC